MGRRPRLPAIPLYGALLSARAQACESDRRRGICARLAGIRNARPSWCSMMKRWINTLADSVFLSVLGCSAAGAIAAVWQIVYHWRAAWKLW